MMMSVTRELSSDNTLHFKTEHKLTILAHWSELSREKILYNLLNLSIENSFNQQQHVLKYLEKSLFLYFILISHANYKVNITWCCFGVLSSFYRSPDDYVVKECLAMANNKRVDS